MRRLCLSIAISYNEDMNDYFPRNIICLTEESVETLYLLGQEARIKGVSAFVKRPEGGPETSQDLLFHKL